jgi:hypothetical protein
VGNMVAATHGVEPSKPTRHWFQYTLGTLLLFATLCGAVLGLLRAQRTMLETEIDDLRETRAENERKIVRLTDQIDSALIERIALEKRNVQLREELARAKECLDYYKIDYKKDYRWKTAPAGLEGVVTVTTPGDMIEISIGYSAGLRKGHKLDVIRTENGVAYHLGRIEVVQTSSNRSVCRVVKKTEGVKIESGDRVVGDARHTE